MSMSENRTFVRVPVDFEVALLLTGTDGVCEVHTVSARVENISDEGVFIRMPQLDPEIKQPLVDGDLQLEMAFDLPAQSESIDAKGKVVWVAKNVEDHEGLGIHFTQLSNDTRNKILLYIMNHVVEENLKHAE